MVVYDIQSLYASLKALGVIDNKQLDQALELSKSKNIPFEQVLLDKDLISDENLGKTIADLLSIPFIRLGEIAIANEVLQEIPQVVAKKQRIIAFRKDKKGLSLAMANPLDIQTINFIEKKSGLPVIVYYATNRDIENALYLYSKNITDTFNEIIKQNLSEANLSQSKHADPPIIKIVDTILEYGYQNRASDIHIGPTKDVSLVRFRIDGILHDIISLPLELHKSIVTRIKVLADLRTDEHQAAQDGKLQFKIDTEEADVRVSIVPTTNGEKVVLRLLSERSRQYSLADLGLSQKDFVKVKNAYEKPYGMILSTGPTGSGKTTSIYSILKLLNKRDVNIMTIEDPVEYDIEGISQIQVNTKTNLTFAEGLRSIVRQDPNIILVGEIRDQDTADIAINSAMTGHLVLSTLHTNDAATAIPRLLDMKIEPFLIASTVTVIIAQRLARKIHTGCRVSKEVEVEKLADYFEKEFLQKAFGKSKSVRLYGGKGCQFDHGFGYSGRVGIFEVLVVNDEIRKAIVDRKDAAEIRNIAIKNGMVTMLEDGIEKAKQGITTLDEVMRVTKE